MVVRHNNEPLVDPRALSHDDVGEALPHNPIVLSRFVAVPNKRESCVGGQADRPQMNVKRWPEAAREIYGPGRRRLPIDQSHLCCDDTEGVHDVTCGIACR
jgi:hypothetical protein